MEKIAFEDFRKAMAYDMTRKIDPCIEIEFCIDGCEIYQESWMGKMLNKDGKNHIYWYGLTKDGSQAYDFDSFEKFADAKVFCDKSIKEIWPLVSLRGIDACDIEERLPFYLDL
jgi:hypothetical protein